jgi:hypothetical protein
VRRADDRAWVNALLLVLNYLVLTAFSIYVGAAQAAPLVISVPERCAPVGIKGKGGGIEVYTKNVKRLTVPDVCAGNPPARLWVDGNDRAVTCGSESNPLTTNTPLQTVQFVRLGKC